MTTKLQDRAGLGSRRATGSSAGRFPKAVLPTSAAVKTGEGRGMQPGWSARLLLGSEWDMSPRSREHSVPIVALLGRLWKLQQVEEVGQWGWTWRFYTWPRFLFTVS